MLRARKRMPSYRPWGTTKDGNIEFESLTDETLEGALKVIRESFFVNENICRAVALTTEPGAPEELEELCLEAAKDGVSVVAIDVASGEVVGVAFNKIHVSNTPLEEAFYHRSSKRCKHKASKGLVDFLVNVEDRLNFFKHYNVDCLLEIMFMATLPAYWQRRIGELLVSSSLEIGKELKRGKKVKIVVPIEGDDVLRNATATPSLVTAVMTSNYSQKIANKLGFERLLELTYDSFEFQGKKYSERIGDEHRGMMMVAKRITV